jgi:hypothetical protein
VQTANMKSRSLNRLVTSLLYCVASMDRKWVLGNVQETTITLNTETIEFTEEKFK